MVLRSGAGADCGIRKTSAEHSIRRDDGNRLLHLASAIKETNFSRSKSTSGQAGNTAVQVWTVEEGFGIGGEFRQN